MATDKPRFTITLPDETYNCVSQYKEENKISTQSKAIQQLITIGLKTVEQQDAEEQKLSFDGLTSEDVIIARNYHDLDSYGKKLTQLVINAETERIKAQNSVGKSSFIEFGTIRHYLYSPAAGPDGLIPGEDYEDIPLTANMPKNADFCLTVSGDSMEPYIHNGQLIYVSESAPLNEFDVGVFYYQGATYVKQYFPQENAVFLLSANPERKDTNISIPRESAQDMTYYGKVIGIKKLPKPEYI